MSDPQEKPWSNNPSAPKISRALYLREKNWFAGHIIGAMLYGVLTVLFFKCIIALLSPVYRRGGGIKWGLVCYTAAMFSLATVHTAMNLHLQSISYIDNREFPAVGEADPGPIGYFESLYSDAINVIANVAFCLSNWLTDGLLLYRCYVIYAKNLWVIAFPSLMFLGSAAMGILALLPSDLVVSLLPWNLAWFSISLSLNVLLTIMIAVGLILRGRNVRAATGSSTGLGGLYKTIATMVIESSALYAVSSLLVIGLWAPRSPGLYLFIPVLMEIQAIAPLLIIQRVANKSALRSKAAAPGRNGTFKAWNQGELTDASHTLPVGHPMGSVDERGIHTLSELAFGEETTIDVRQDRV